MPFLLSGFVGDQAGNPLARLMSHIKKWLAFLLLTNKSFRFFRWLGVHVTPVHFYSPIPDVREIDEAVWEQPSDLVGVDMNPAGQQSLMETVFSKYQAECNFPRRPILSSHDYYTQNDYFGYVSAAAMHSMVRHFRPRQIVEVGAGFSTRVLANAARLNAAGGHPVQVTAIDPYPGELLRGGFPGLHRLLPLKVQAVDLSIFTDLRANDILSIDTSHAVRLGGDVVHLYLNILSRLNPGVLVHIHDIFLPHDYPRQWVADRRFFWNEQYLLQAMLVYSRRLQVIWGQKYAESHFPERYQAAFSARTGYDENFDSYSFWLRIQE